MNNKKLLLSLFEDAQRLAELVSEYEKEIGNPAPCWAMRDNLRKRMFTTAERVKAAYGKGE